MKFFRSKYPYLVCQQNLDLHVATGVPFPFNPLIKGIWKFLNAKCILLKKSSGFAKDFHVNNYEFFNLITIILYWLMFMMEIYTLFSSLFPLYLHKRGRFNAGCYDAVKVEGEGGGQMQLFASTFQYPPLINC